MFFGQNIDFWDSLSHTLKVIKTQFFSVLLDKFRKLSNSLRVAKPVRNSYFHVSNPCRNEVQLR